MGIILRYVCWGTHGPPPPPGPRRLTSQPTYPPPDPQKFLHTVECQDLNRPPPSPLAFHGRIGPLTCDARHRLRPAGSKPLPLVSLLGLSKKCSGPLCHMRPVRAVLLWEPLCLFPVVLGGRRAALEGVDRAVRRQLGAHNICSH